MSGELERAELRSELAGDVSGARETAEEPSLHVVKTANGMLVMF
jgi:hypothetical protein